MIYAERWHWTPEQVDQLTIEQDDWLIPIAQAFDDEREYQEKKAQEAAERKAKAKQKLRGSEIATAHLNVNAAKWWAAMDDWHVLAHHEGVDANLEAAQAVQRRTRSLLSRYHHGPGTHTPSPIGQPPAEISGRLLASIEAEHDGDDAIVGPTRSASSARGPYGRFLELGGEHHASAGPGAMIGGNWVEPLMWWWEDGFWHNAQELTKAPRPYLKPATEDAIRSGEIHDIYWRHWLVAQEAVT